MIRSGGWWGTDLDGTLAQIAPSTSTDMLEIGQPIPLMVQRVRGWLRDGKEVRIVTARANTKDNPNVEKQKVVIDKWVRKYFGQSLQITYKKDHQMIELWDDRAVQVIPNTGERVLELEGNLVSSDIESLHCDAHFAHSSGCRDCNTAALFSSYIRDEKLEKAAPIVSIHPLKIAIDRPSPKIQLIKSQLHRKLYIFLNNSASDVAVALRKNHVKKVDDKKKDLELLALAYTAIIWNDLVDQIYSDLYEIAKVSAQEGLSQLGIQEDADKLAEEYAKTRTSDMVGEGTRYSIADPTREDLKSFIEKAKENNYSEAELANDIKTAGMFSKSRAGLIADTEVAMAQVFNHLEIWKRSGRVKSVSIKLSDDHEVEDLCDSLAEGSPYLIENCPEIPSHPNCKCSIVVEELK